MSPKKQTTYCSGKVRRGIAHCLSASIFLLASCATPPPAAPSPAEQARAEIALGSELAQRVEAQIQLAQDPEVTIYLRSVAEKLLRAVPGGANASVGVLVVRDRDGAWRNFGLPGNRIYLSLGLLKTLDYEHELAAAVALELAHLSQKHLLQRVQEIYRAKDAMNGSDIPPEPFSSADTSNLRSLDFFSPAGAFSFPESAQISAVEGAFGALYGTGFDPRGLPALFAIYRRNAAKSPFEESTLDRLISASRHVIARTAPLRNPILSSQDFVQFKKRIRRL